MRAKEIMNADMATVGRWAREGFAWWIAELSELLPRQWRGSLMRGPKAMAELRDGTIVVRGAEEGAALPQSAVLVLPPQSVLLREVELPVLANADLRRMLALDIDRLAPFRAGTALFDFEVTREASDGRQPVTVAVIPKQAVEDAVSATLNHGVRPTAVSVDTPGGPRFDFMRALQGSAGFGGKGKRVAYWWTVAGALAAANLLLLIYGDEARLESLREAVEAQETPVSVADRLRRKVYAEAARRSALMKEARELPLRAIAAITAAMPDAAWVHRFEWNGKTVHIAGYQRAPLNTLRAVETSPALRNARALTAAAATAPSGMQSFDISAELEPEARR